MAFRLGIADTIKIVPPAIKGQFQDIVKGMNSDTFFADDSWNGSITKVFMVKMSKDNYDIALTRKIGGKHKLSQGRRRCDFTLGKSGDVRVFKIAFQESSKKPGAPDGGTTQQQELASLFMIRKALSLPSKIYTNIDDLKSDKKGFNELLSVYPELENNTTWLNGLIAQQKTVGQKLKAGRYNEFNRDGGFMDFISKLVSEKFGIRKKDNWNPADVWLEYEIIHPDYLMEDTTEYVLTFEDINKEVKTQQVISTWGIGPLGLGPEDEIHYYINVVQ